MTATMNSFLETVSSLKNISIDEDFKTVGTLLYELKKSNQLTSKDWNEVISKIPLESNLEKMIVMEVINRWRLSDKVIEALKSDDLFLTSQAMKCSWFFRDDCDLLLDCSLFVKEFLSHLSVASRLQMLKNYSRFLRSKTKADNLFSAVEHEYGRKAPLVLLPACSESLISSILERKIMLTDEELFQLYLYHPVFTIEYISSRLNKTKQNNEFYAGNFEKIFLKLISKDTSKFVEMFNKYFKLMRVRKLGRNLTKKLIKTDFDSVLRNPHSYMEILEMKTLVSCLSHLQIKQLHFALLPATLMDLKNALTAYYRKNFLTMVDHVKKSFGQEMMLNNFIKKYNIEPLDVPFKLDETFIECLPKEHRSSWAEKEMSANLDLSFNEKINYMAYLSSLSSLKRMLPEALNPEARRQLIRSMVESVKRNGSVNEVNEVITFVIEKLRNDLEEVKAEAFSSLLQFDLLQLEVKDWTGILQLIDIMKMNHEHHRYECTISKIVNLYIRRRLADGLDVEEQMKQLLSMVTSYEFEFDKGDSVEHFILNWLNENINVTELDLDLNKQKSVAVKLFSAINKWNAKYPTHIRHKAWLVEYIIDNCMRTHLQSDIVRSIKKDPDLKRKVFDSFPKNYCGEILLYKLHYDTHVLLDNIDTFYDGIKKSYSPSQKYFLNRLKMYNKGELVSKLKEHCLTRFNSGESVGSRCKGLIVYSHLCMGPELLSVIGPYYPKTDRADTVGEEAYELYRFQTAAAASLNNINPPYSVICALDKFLRGDYLKLSLGSLNGIITKTSQIKSLDYLNKKLDTPVSIRKNILRLYKVIAPRTDTCKLLFTCFKSETNLSLRVLLLESMYSLLKEEQNEVAWTSVKDAVQLLTEKDIAQISSIFNLSFIPERYISDYIEAIWLRLDQLKDEKDMRQRIFRLITRDTIALLSDEFSTLLFHLTYTTEEVDHAWNNYISLFLLMREESFETRLSLVLGLIGSHFKEKWGVLNEEFCAVSQVQLSSLLGCICSMSLECTSKTAEPVTTLVRLQQGVLQLFSELDVITDTFSISLHIEFITNKVTLVNLQQVNFIKRVCFLVDHYCNTYGEALIHLLSSKFENFISDKLNSYDVNYDINLLIAHMIVSSNASKMSLIMALKLMPSFSYLKKETDINRFKEVVGVISGSTVNEIKVLTKVYITNK